MWMQHYLYRDLLVLSLLPGNFLVSKVPPFKPILLDFGLTKTLTFTKKQALAKMLLACAEVLYGSQLAIKFHECSCCLECIESL